MRQLYRNQILAHLGLVAAMCDELGLGDVIEHATQQNLQMRMVTVGNALKAMVLKRLGFVTQQLYVQKVEEVIQQGPFIQPAHSIGEGLAGQVLRYPRMVAASDFPAQPLCQVLCDLILAVSHRPLPSAQGISLYQLFRCPAVQATPP